MAFTAKDVQTLRQTTNCGMMDCKKALTEADGDMDKAIEFLREKGLAAVAKKANRIAAEGVVIATFDQDKKIGAVVEVNSETDFVAKNADFIAFVELCAKTVIDQNPADIDALLACKAGERTIEELLRDKVLVIGENLKIRRFVRAEGDIATYIHGGGKIGVMVKFETTGDVASKAEFIELGKDVAMQIAAINPLYLNKEEVPAEVIEKEKEILIAQIQNDEKLKNKPAQVIDKMVDGKVVKYFKENCLVEQSFVKDDKVTVGEHINDVAKTLGATIKAVSFVRFEKGEGIEKREDNFADEVANMVK
ncbi:MAG: translation elongation factor Ts [Oscillospiraceae bacterium]